MSIGNNSVSMPRMAGLYHRKYNRISSDGGWGVGEARTWKFAGRWLFLKLSIVLEGAGVGIGKAFQRNNRT